MGDLTPGAEDLFRIHFRAELFPGAHSSTENPIRGAAAEHGVIHSCLSLSMGNSGAVRESDKGHWTKGIKITV